MGLNEKIEIVVRDWFASEKGKTATKMAIALAAGEVIGYLGTNSTPAVILIVATFAYVAVWVANKYTNLKKLPSVQGGGNQ